MWGLLFHWATHTYKVEIFSKPAFCVNNTANIYRAILLYSGGHVTAPDFEYLVWPRGNLFKRSLNFNLNVSEYTTKSMFMLVRNMIKNNFLSFETRWFCRVQPALCWSIPRESMVIGMFITHAHSFHFIHSMHSSWRIQKSFKTTSCEGAFRTLGRHHIGCPCSHYNRQCLEVRSILLGFYVNTQTL